MGDTITTTEDVNNPEDLLQIARDKVKDESTTKEELEKILRHVQNTKESLLETLMATRNRASAQIMFKLNLVESSLANRIEEAPTENQPEPQPTNRIAKLDFDIEQSELENTDDLKRFLEAVNKLFDWHKSKAQRKLYMAPYFPMVQSSGMGKTKLLYEAKKQGNEVDEANKRGNAVRKKKLPFCGGVAYCLVLCTSGGGESVRVNNVFDHELEVPKECSEGKRDRVWKELDNILEDAVTRTDNKKVVIFFDESNELIKADGWYFRSVRWWLREKKKNPRASVVAVFAGTTSRLANFFAEPPESVASRDASKNFHTSGKMLYPPFYEITTTGLGVLQPAISYSGSVTEYDNSIAFGRPLFHRLRMNGALEEKEGHILSRMLRKKVGGPLDKYGNTELFGILGTRVQMGQVGFEMASNLVAFGYAALSYFHSEDQCLADITFLPDPVCARLAMMLMIKGCKIKEALCSPPRTLDGISGESPSFWANRASQIFSHGLCRPQKGDVGEVAGALYMLFCADSLREKSANNKQLKTFSVDFNEWVLTMRNPGIANAEASGEGQNPGSASSQQGMGGSEEGDTYSASVSFIQVCRNYFRHSLKDMCLGGMLEQWYKAGRALYVYANCPAYDIIAPIRYRSGGSDRYCPLLVSIKNRITYSDAQQKAAHESMADVMEESEVETGVAVLLLLGLDNETVPQKPLSRIQFKPGLLRVTVIVPQRDVFGIDNLIRGSTIGGGERSEVFSSQAEIPLCTGSVAANLLRKTSKRQDTHQFLDKLLDERMEIKLAAHEASTAAATVADGGGEKRPLDNKDGGEDKNKRAKKEPKVKTSTRKRRARKRRSS